MTEKWHVYPSKTTSHTRLYGASACARYSSLPQVLVFFFKKRAFLECDFPNLEFVSGTTGSTLVHSMPLDAQKRENFRLNIPA